MFGCLLECFFTRCATGFGEVEECETSLEEPVQFKTFLPGNCGALVLELRCDKSDLRVKNDRRTHCQKIETFF